MITIEQLQSLVGFQFLNLDTIKIVYSAFCQNSHFEEMWYSATTILIIENGLAEIKDEYQTYRLNVGDIAIIKPFSKISIQKNLANKIDKGYRSFVFTLLPDFLDTFLEQDIEQSFNHEAQKDHVFVINKPTFLGDFRQLLYRVFNEKEQLDEEALKSKTLNYLKILTKAEPKLIPFLQQRRAPEKISLNELMLNTFLADYSVPQLAQLSGRSLSAFKREFKSTFNDTPHQWIIKQKMDLAEKVFRNSDFTPSAIYPLLGFKELSHFSSTFRKVKGYNPSEVKNALLNYSLPKNSAAK